MKKTIFISRPLTEHSILWDLEKDENLSITAMSLVEFSPLSFQLPENLDWLFFYSKTGVDFFFNSFLEKGVLPLSLPKLAAVGEGTAKQIEKYNQKSDFIGTGLANTTAPMFEQVAKNQSVAFVQAKNSGQSVQKILSNQINKFDLLVYDNQEITNILFEIHNILVFTSPKNIIAYFNAAKKAKKSIQNIDFVVVIGYISENELKNHYSGTYFVADKPDEASLNEAIKKGIKKY